MGDNSKRIQFSCIQDLTSSTDDDYQTLTDTSLIKVGDVLEFWDRNAAGCLDTLIGTRTVTGVCKDAAITLDSTIDLTTVTGTAAIRNRNIWNMEDAVKRLYQCGMQAKDYKIQWEAPISSCNIDTPIIGQSEQFVSDASCWETGDSWAIISDEGLAGTGTVVSTDLVTNDVTIDDSIDCSGLTNPKLVNTSLDLKEQLLRLKQAIDEINAPRCEKLLDGDCNNTVFYSSQTFKQNSSSTFMGGNRKRLGSSCGTRASLVNDVTDAEITFTSLVLGLDGNDISIEFVDPGGTTPLSVALTGTYDGADRVITVTLETVAAAIVSTAQEVADLLNADAATKRLVQAIWGGDGSGVQSALVPTPMAGGLDDATSDTDYCEIQIIDNNVATGGYGIISFNIRPDEIKRLQCPARENEELDICYAKAV